ncbi:hypothetical protein RND71_006442 [Anisodus tanguticus]|uniref:DEK-C domain-containing protein n=1 Tax=Anisodus tanguticus TaxID=243964 RepID=A0AAE1STC8_9SOLA|nr:hypothetical protein RND71_006442 [Anisodus tanguticus]
MAAQKETLETKKHEKETIEQEEKVKQNAEMDDKEENGENKEEMEGEEKAVKKEEKEEEGRSDDAISPKTPGSRPTRERKTVERYFESLAARGSATKPLTIEKGQGTQLKDIPNGTILFIAESFSPLIGVGLFFVLAYKLSKRKPDDNLQILHSILYGKRTKAHNLKKNIGQFSGYVWVENEEKHRAKLKERLDKCVKEKLLFFCDILNIPDELSVKLLDFLESPHSTTDLLLADKEQKSKKRKSKGKTSKSKGSLDKAAGKSAKYYYSELQSRKGNKALKANCLCPLEGTYILTTKNQKSVGEKRKRSPKIIEEEESDDEPSSTRDESGNDNDDEEVNEVGSDQEESGSEKAEEEEEEEEEEKPKKSNENVSSKKDSENKVTEKPKSVKKDNPAKSPKSSTKSTKVSPSTSSKRGASGADSLVTPKKQKVEKKSQKEENGIAKKNPSNKKQSTKSPAKFSEKEGKEKSGEKVKAEPSNEEIHEAVVNILKEVDFNSATLSDIIRQLGSHFGEDLMHRKAEVKAIITDVINNMSDEEGDDPEAEAEDDAKK